jgi:hypothetical protein
MDVGSPLPLIEGKEATMKCQLYSADGSLVKAGPCGVRRDGAIEMIAERSRRRLRPGDGPLTLVEGRRRYPVRVEAVHDPLDPSLKQTVEVYHLTPVEVESQPRSAPATASTRS